MRKGHAHEKLPVRKGVDRSHPGDAVVEVSTQLLERSQRRFRGRGCGASERPSAHGAPITEAKVDLELSGLGLALDRDELDAARCRRRGRRGVGVESPERRLDNNDRAHDRARREGRQAGDHLIASVVGDDDAQHRSFGEDGAYPSHATDRDFKAGGGVGVTVGRAEAHGRARQRPKHGELGRRGVERGN